MREKFQHLGIFLTREEAKKVRGGTVNICMVDAECPSIQYCCRYTNTCVAETEKCLPGMDNIGGFGDGGGATNHPAEYPCSVDSDCGYNQHCFNYFCHYWD